MTMESILLKIHDERFPENSAYHTKIVHDAERHFFKTFYNFFAVWDPNKISWNMICQYVVQNKNYKYCLHLVLLLLENNYGLNDHKKSLKRLYPQLKAVFSQGRFGAWSTLFSGDNIESLYICDTTVGYYDGRHFLVFLPYENTVIQEEMYHHYQEIGRLQQYFTPKFTLYFEKSLGTLAHNITSYRDFSDITFWKQARFFLLHKDLSCQEVNYCLRLLVQFYRALVHMHPDYRYFDNSLHMSEALLFSPRLVPQIEKNYYVLPLALTAKYQDHNRLIFLLRGYSSQSTQIKDDDFVSLDLSTLKSDFYRNELLKYFVSMSSITVVTWSGQIGYIRNVLTMLEDTKSQMNYPNQKQDYLNNQEALLIRFFCSNESVSLSTRNNQIGAIRRFLLWERDENKQIRFDDMFFEYLTQYEEPSKTQGQSIPDEHLAKISEWLSTQASKNHEMNLTYAALHLALETEFRISQICHLKVDCIKPSAKPHEYIVETYHKTGHGQLSSFVITELTYRHLMRIIEDTEPYREKCTRSKLANYIFLYDGNMHSVSLMNSSKFRACFQKACVALGLPKYSSRNIRDTHMTKSFEYVLRHGKSDLVMSALSKHKYIDTTKNHYIDQKLNEMLETTYNVIIGDLDDCYNPSSHIKNKIPSTVNVKETLVENGCGNCTASECTMRNALPCLICDSFITTVQHEPAFRRAIEGIDKLIQTPGTKHDKDDLTTIKILLVMYLKAIYKKRQEVLTE